MTQRSSSAARSRSDADSARLGGGATASSTTAIASSSIGSVFTGVGVLAFERSASGWIEVRTFSSSARMLASSFLRARSLADGVAIIRIAFQK